MSNTIRQLSVTELNQVAGGDFDCYNVPIYWDGNPFPIPDPEAPHPIPVPDYTFFFNPNWAWGTPTPEPALPKKPGP